MSLPTSAWMTGAKESRGRATVVFFDSGSTTADRNFFFARWGWRAAGLIGRRAGAGSMLDVLGEPLELDAMLSELAEGVRVDPPLVGVLVDRELMAFAQVHQHLERLAAFLVRQKADDLPTVAPIRGICLRQDRRGFRFLHR